MKWVTDDGGIQIAADIQGTALNIEAKFLTNNNLNLALKAAYQLMTNISKLYQSSRATPNTSRLAKIKITCFPPNFVTDFSIP